MTGHPRAAGRTGRRPGRPDTRQAILRAARSAFAEAGFSGATIRRIAADAGVDPALVHHYFGSKDKLLLATVQIPVDPRQVVAAITDGPRDTLGVRLATAVMHLWGSPAGAPLAAALRSAVEDPAAARTIQEFLLSRVITPVLRHIDCPAAELERRSALVISQMVGVIVGRHIIGLEPLASLPVEVLAPSIGATVQRYLTGELPGG